MPPGQLTSNECTGIVTRAMMAQYLSVTTQMESSLSINAMFLSGKKMLRVALTDITTPTQNKL